MTIMSTPDPLTPEQELTMIRAITLPAIEKLAKEIFDAAWPGQITSKARAIIGLCDMHLKETK